MLLRIVAKWIYRKTTLRERDEVLRSKRSFQLVPFTDRMLNKEAQNAVQDVIIEAFKRHAIYRTSVITFRSPDTTSFSRSNFRSSIDPVLIVCSETGAATALSMWADRATLQH